MKAANTVIGSESAAVGLRGKNGLGGDDELTMADSPQRILRSALAALTGGRVLEIVEQFADRFTFTDHALRLEFTDKPSLTEFFEKFRDLFPDATLEIASLFEGREHEIAEWQLSATESVSLGSISHRVPISLQGSTIICIANGRIVRWSQYYDPSSSLPISLGAFFTKSTKLSVDLKEEHYEYRGEDSVDHRRQPRRR